MAITVQPRHLDGAVTDTGLPAEEGIDLESQEMLYLVTGTSDQAQAIEALRGATPLNIGLLERGKITADPITPDRWDATVQYNAPPVQEDESAYTFDMTGGTQHITQSLALKGRYGLEDTPAGYGGAIGVKADSVEGVDITVPVYKFSMTYRIDNRLVTPEYKAQLFRLTGKTNKEEWGEFAAGEVLFLGPSGSRKGRKGKWEITFSFAASPNMTDMTVAGILHVNKKGWEYLWLEYEQDVVGNRLGWVAEYAYVEQVYPEGDFADLLPTDPTTGR